MSAITFDTHAHIKKLKEKGISEQQAEAFVEMVKEAQETDKTALATKADLAELKAELIKWFVGISFAQAAMVLSILKLH